MSAPVKTPDPEGSKPEKPTSFLGVIVGWALAAVPAVAGTIGFLGFVAVIGAAIQWTRFESAKLPADQAVHAIPQRELVAIGAVSLIAFTVLGLLAVLLAFIVDRRGDPSRSTRKALVFIALLEGLVVILLVWPPRVQALAAGVWMVAFAVASMLALRWLVTAWVDDGRRSEVFFSVALFGGVFAAARSIRSPKVQPAALVRKGSDRGVCGIYITETDSRVYLGRVEKEAGTGDNAVAGAGRVFWIPKNDVEMLSTGPLQGIDRANARAPVLLAELYADRPEEPGRTAKPTTETVAVERTRTSGSDSVKQTRTTTEEQPVVRDRPADRPASEETTCTDQELAGVGG